MPSVKALVQLDLGLFNQIAAAQSLAALPGLKLIWKQCNVVTSGTRRSTSTSHAGSVAVLAKAAANCLRLVLQQQAAGTGPTPPLALPSKPASVTAVRMTLCIFACFTNDMMKVLEPFSNNLAQYQQAHDCVEAAVREAGGVQQLPWHATLMWPGLRTGKITNCTHPLQQGQQCKRASF